MPPCLTLSIIRYGSRVRWRNPGNWVAPSTTPWCRSYWKGSLRVTLDYGRQLFFLLLDLARKLKKLKQRTLAAIPIGALRTVLKVWEKGPEEVETRERIETTETAALLRSAWILIRVLETWGDLSLKHQCKSNS